MRKLDPKFKKMMKTDMAISAIFAGAFAVVAGVVGWSQHGFVEGAKQTLFFFAAILLLWFVGFGLWLFTRAGPFGGYGGTDGRFYQVRVFEVEDEDNK